LFPADSEAYNDGYVASSPVHCLYCGRLIGPLRLLRDREFCSPAHHDGYREQYRQRVHKLLGPEPLPTRMAGLLGKPAKGVRQAPPDEIRAFPKTAGAGWLSGFTAAMVHPEPAWRESAGAGVPGIHASAFCISMRPAGGRGSGVARPDLAVRYGGGRTLAGVSVSPLVARIPMPSASELVGTQPLLNALPPCALVRTGPAASPARRLVAAAVRVTPARTGAWPLVASKTVELVGRLSDRQPMPVQTARIAPQAAVSQPHAPLPPPLSPAAAGPHGPVRCEPEAAKALGTGIERLAGAPGLLGTSCRLSDKVRQPELARAATPIAAEAIPTEARIAALPAGMPAASAPMAAIARGPAAQDLSLSLVEAFHQARPRQTAAPMPLEFSGAIGKGVPLALDTPGFRRAEIVLPMPRATAAAGALAPVRAARPELQPAGMAAVPALPGVFSSRREPRLPGIAATLPGNAAGAPLVSAPPASETTLEAAAPPAAAPAWRQHGYTAAATDSDPRAAASIAPTGTLAEPLDILIASGRNAGRALRSCAVLWTLRVTRMCIPAFDQELIKEKFCDLVLAGQGAQYSGDVRPGRARVAPLGKRRNGAASSRSKWIYAGAAAAALLLAGVLWPRASSSGLAGKGTWNGAAIRQAIASRATRSLADDFRGGLNQWKGLRESLPKGWSYNQDGYMHPGQLALYRPSVPLSDYRFEFMAQVENKSVDWVVRARDANNYYALKFAVVEPGPRPLVAMVRYPVIEGNRGTRVQTPVRMMIHANTPYRVTVDVKGNRYRAYIEGQQADYWTDDGLKSGGVGFFSEAGERARVYWVKLESHDDLLGRICALLAGKASEGGTNTEKQAMDYRHSGTIEKGQANSSGGEELAMLTAQEGRISRALSKAASLHLEGKREEAAQELRRAIDSGERHPALFFALGQLQYELQDYGTAAHSYAQAALLQPLHPTAHFNAGVCLAKLERWEDATESFHMAVANDPARMEAHLALGACLVHAGRHNEAVDAYDRFLARHPDHEEALFGKAVALQKRDRTTEAAELYRRILSRNPGSEEALSNLVSLSLANQDYEQVRKYAKRLAEVHPRSEVALEGLAAAAFAAGDHAAAAEHSRKLAELAPQVFENWFNLGVASHKAGDLAMASEAYARAAKLQPESPQAHLNLGVALHESGDLKGAAASYQRAFEIDANLAGVHWNLGLASEQLGDPEAAEKFFARVPTGSPDYDDALFRIGHLRLQRGNFPGSIEAFQGCLQRRPTWPEARLNLGIAYWRSGDKEAARTCFQELTASGGESKEALRGLAALALERQEFDKAFEIYRQLMDSGDRSPELLYNAALICQRRGETEDAAVLYREALKVDPQFGEALLNLGHALMTLGNEFEARSCWRKAVIAKPELAQHYFEPAQAT